MSVVHTHCHYCMSLCGISVTVEDNTVVGIEPDRENPYTWRDFCRKGKTAGKVVEHPQRILTPMKRVGDHYVEATYEEALADISTRLNTIIDEHGADSVGTYHGNPLGFSFSGSVFFNGLMDALGTGNRYWVGSVDENNAHVVMEEMYGFSMLVLSADIDDSRCFLLVGMDPAQSKFGWMDVVPDGWGRALKAQENGAEIIVVDPRTSESAKRADLHVPVRPGQDWAFLLGVLHVVFAEGLDRPADAVPLTGVEELRELATTADLDDLSARCEISVDVIRDVARRFARAPRAMCLVHTGVAHTATGTVGDWLGQVLNAVTNRIDMPGGRRFERGYTDLVKTLSSLVGGSPHRTRLRDQPAIAGFHSLAELTDEIITPGQGQIRAMVIANGNPVVSGPDSVALDDALAGLDLLVAVDIVQRESHRHADWLIPGTHFLEREGLHVAMSGLMDQPFVQYANKAVEPPPGVMEEWEFFLNLALALRRPLFGVRGINGVAKVSRRLARVLNRPGLALNPRWIEWLMVTIGRRLRYKDIRKQPHGFIYGEKRYGDLAGVLITDDKTVHCAPSKLVAHCRELLSSPPLKADPEFPLIMVNRRSRESMNSWLNETPGLFASEPFNSAEVSPSDAEGLGIVDGQRIRIRSAHGAIEIPAKITGDVRPGIVVVPHGWGSRVFDPVRAMSSGHRV